MLLPGDHENSIVRAVDCLASGGVLGLPTETVYGLAADAGNDEAVQQIFALKQRPTDHPLIVHVRGAADISRFAQDEPDFARRLVDAFWPGPLTIILPRCAGAANVAAGGHDTVGLRCPSHPVAQRVLAACAQRGVFGLAAPSANRFGRVSPTTAQHVAAEFGKDLLVLDGGPCAVGIESVIVDCSRGRPVLLRPGQLSRPQLARAAGQALATSADMRQPAPHASGTLPAHYAPRARLRLMSARELRTALGVLGQQAGHIGVWARIPLETLATSAVHYPMPDDAAHAAHELFAVLHDFDTAGVRLIWVEQPPDDPTWDGVRDRLQRAAATD